MNTTTLQDLRTKLDAEIAGACRQDVIDALYEAMDEIENRDEAAERATERAAAEAAELRSLSRMLLVADRNRI